MIYATPQQDDVLTARLRELDKLRRALGHELRQPGAWLGTLRRFVRASTVQSSVSIEGFTVSAGEAVALVAGEAAPSEPTDEDRMAVVCYARAMEHVGVMAVDPAFHWNDRVILDLHFDSCQFQRDRNPGLWRTGPIFVTAPEGGVAYTAPAAEDVGPLMSEVLAWLESDAEQTHVVVRAAMAHLHTVSVHPFRDGNGRISRIVQSLVLAREGDLSPEFASIEEYLGGHTREYYDVLHDVQGGRYQPERDATPWVLFCVDAHIAQARKRLDQIAEAGARWTFLEELVESRRWPDRLVIALEQSLIGGTDRGSYEREAEVSLATASSDFRRLLDGGLIDQTGRGRNIRYYATDELRESVAAAIARAVRQQAAPRR